MSKPPAISRRKAVKLGAAAAALPLVHIRTAGAAGKLNIGFWDHWVPGANDVMQKQVNAWADKNKVEVNADFITSSGGKLALTPAAETQAKAGHDVMTFFTWDVHNYADHLAPVDDVMQRLIASPWRGERGLLLPRPHQWTLARRADEQRHADEAALRPDQLVQQARPGHPGDVSGQG